MLQRLIHKPPVPIDPIPLDKFIFDKRERIRKYVLPICASFDVDPQELYPRTFQEFIGKEPSSNVLILRYNEFEIQRRSKIDHLRDHVKDYLRARQKEKVGISSPQTTQEHSLSPRRDHYISVNFDSAPRMMTAGSPSTIQVTMDSPKDRVITGSSMNYSIGRPILAAISRGSKRSKSSKTGNENSNVRAGMEIQITNEDDSVVFQEEKSVVEKELQNNFKRHLKHRIVNKERQLNASVLVTKREEEFRNKVKEDYLEREKKWTEKKQKLMLTKKQPIVRLDDHDKERKWRLKLEEKEEAINAIKRQFDINARLAMSEKKRKEENDKKYEKIRERNRITEQRCQSVAGQMMRSGDRDRASPKPPDLEEIEKKLIESQERKDKILRERKMHVMKASGDLTEKLKKLQVKKEQEEQDLMREIAKKLEKGKLRESSSSGRKLKPSTSQAKSAVQQRLEEIKREEARKEKKLAEELVMKEKQVLERLHEKKRNVDDYIAERRERRAQRFNHSKINTSAVEEEYNKWIDSTNTSYRLKLDDIQKKKFLREKQLKVLDRIERGSVRGDVRVSYSFDQGR